MANSIRQWFTRLAVAVALWPASAEAHTTARSFAELIGIVKVDETVVITDTRSRVADGLGNGVLIGAGVGLGVALAILATAGSGDGYILPSAKAGAPLLMSGIGALAGALIDRAHEGGRVLYVSPKRSGPVVSPFLGKDRQGALVSVSF